MGLSEVARILPPGDIVPSEAYHLIFEGTERANILPYSTISSTCLPLKKKTNRITFLRHQVNFGALPNPRGPNSLSQEYLPVAANQSYLQQHLCHHLITSRKNVDYSAGSASYLILKIGGGEEALLLSGGIFLVRSICLPLGRCPLWHCLGCLVCVLGPLWYWLQPFGPSTFGVLSDLRLHLFEWCLCSPYCFCTVTF